jgi:voltage-gated potassium channel
MTGKNNGAGWQKRRDWLYEIIFKADTPTGKLYDVLLLIVIVVSVVAVMLDSVEDINTRYRLPLYSIEWGFTLLFTVDYVVRLCCAKRPLRYAVSFFGIVDLLSVIPTYLSVVLPGAHYLVAIRFLRVLRFFRILNLSSYQKESHILLRALACSARRIVVFLLTVLTLVVVFGSMMYVIEGSGNGFTSIPRSIYWAVVTLTTVGYGDISPQTSLGQALAAVIMILGYSIIVVPTGIVTVAIADAREGMTKELSCSACGATRHDTDASFCRKCGQRLDRDSKA